MENTLKYILILLIIVVFYYLLNCNNNGFSIGGDEYQCQEYIQDIAPCCNNYENNCSDGFPYYCDTDCSESFDNFKNNCSNTKLGDTIEKSRGYYNDIINKSCKNTCSNISLEPDIDNICKEKILKDFFKEIKPENLYNNVIESYCNNDGKKNGVFISILDIDLDYNAVYIDNSGSFLRNDLSWKLWRDGFGLLWDPEDLNNPNNFFKCAYSEDGDTTSRFNTSNRKVQNRCGKFVDCSNSPNMCYSKDVVPIECKNSDCILEMFLQMKNIECPCNYVTCWGGWNEVVYNTDYEHKSFKEFYENNDNIKPSGLIFSTGKEILQTYSYDIYFMKKTFFLDTKVIILFQNDPYKAPVFNGITTLENFEEYLRNLDIKRSNDKCNINKPCPDQSIQ